MYKNQFLDSGSYSLLDKDVICLDDVLFTKNIGCFKRGERYPVGYIVVNLTDNTYILQMNTDPEGLETTFSEPISLF